jgi:hypothetical protein
MGSFLRIHVPLALLGLLAFAAPAHAEVNRCTDAQGNVTFTDRPCGKDEKKQAIETETAPQRSRDVSPNASRDTSADVDRQMQQFNDQLAAKMRDLQARCDQGDQKACKDAICGKVFTEGASPSRYRDCATAGGFASTSAWAQMSKVSNNGSGTTHVSIVCLVNPEVITLGGKSITIYRQMDLQQSDHASAFHERDRWTQSWYSEGPDFDSWEEAAEQICRTRPGK